ncbi:MFS transporter [Maricaulaceae bacterium MS644]
MKPISSPLATPSDTGALKRGMMIGLIAFLTLIDLFAAQAILPALAATFEVSATSMASAVNASTFGMAAGSLITALVARRIDRRLGVWLSLVVLAVPTALLVHAGDITSFAALRVAQGLCMAAAFTLTMAYLAEECTPDEAAGALAAYITGNVASNLAGRILSANVAEWIGAAETFYIFAVLNLVGAAIAYVYLRPSLKRPSRGMVLAPPLQAWRAHISTPGLPAAFLGGFLILFVFLGIFTYVNFLLAGPGFTLSTGQLGLVYLVFLPAMITTPLAGPLVARYGMRIGLFVGLGIAAVGLVLTVPANLSAVLAGLALVGIGTFAAQAALTGYVSSVAMGDRAAASGLYLTAYYVGGLAGTLVLGLVFAMAGWAGVVAGSFAALCLIALLSFRLVPPASS